MPTMTSFPEGTFSWVDLATTDLESSKKFYQGLLNWEDFQTANEENSFYTKMGIAEGPQAAIFKMPADMKKENIPPHWTSYVRVNNVEEKLQKALELGAKTCLEITQVFDAGKMAMFFDTQGATVAMWEAGTFESAAPADNKPGTFCWNELATKNLDESVNFYRELFGWEFKTESTPKGPYTMIVNKGRMNGGVLQMTEEWGDIPSHWMVYFAVEDINKAKDYIHQNNGKVEFDPIELPVGSFFVAQDPQGAYFTAMSMSKADPT